MPYSKYKSPMKLIHMASSSGVLGLGGFVVAERTALNSVIIYLAKFGTAGGSETLTAKVFANTDLTAPLSTSAAVTLSTLENMATNWAGWARFTFASPYQLAPDRQYYLGLTSANYTANGTTFFIAVQMDDHSPFNRPAWGSREDTAKFRIEGARQWPA